MRIRFVSPPKALQKGGIENAVEGLRDALTRLGIEVIDSGDERDTEAIHHFHGLWIPGHSKLALRLARAGRRYVVSPHGMLEPWAYRNRWWKKVPYFHLMEKRVLRGSASLFVTSAMERDHLGQLCAHPRIEVLPLGCRDIRGPDEAVRDSLGWRNDEWVMVYLSRVDPKKGLHLLLEAMASLPAGQRVIDRLAIVGDGPEDYRVRLEEIIRRSGPALPAVDWIGPVWGEGRWPYLQAADAFCLPTHSENFGIAVLEALHAGTPVLTTTGTPWREYRDLDGMFIADPTVASLAKVLGDLGNRLERGWNRADRDALSAWAGSEFLWENLAPKYRAAYQSCLIS